MVLLRVFEWYAFCDYLFERSAIASDRENTKGLQDKEETNMLWTIFLILLVLWALGFGVAGAALGNFIHILLVLAVVVLAIQLITGRRAAL